MNVNDLCINCFNPTGGEEVCMYCGFIQTDKPRQLCHLYPHTILNGRYIIGNVINNGGFGVVYKAYDTKLETIVAIKELLPTQNSMVNRVPQTTNVIPVNEERKQQFEILKKRFLQEARMMAQFSNCDSVVRIFDFFEANNTAYLVMEFLDGITLREQIDRNNSKLSYEEAMKVMMPIMEALAVVHKSGVVHRDVSPDNIFICSNGQIKLIDFGAAKFDENENTNNNTVVMKPGYTPPEQYRTKGKIGAYSDIYSVGAVLYTVLSGDIPEESIDRLEKDKLEKLSKLGVQLPVHAEKSIMKAMALREGARHKSMDDFIKAIKGEKRVDFPEVELKKRKIIRAVSVAMVFVVMIASVFAAYQIKNNNGLVPSKATTITLWYRDTGNEDLNKRWSLVAEEFSAFAESEKSNLKGTKLTVVGVPDEEYEEKLAAAFKDGNAPDIYQANGVDFSDHAASLGSIYGEIKEDDFNKTPFDLMKDTLKDKDQIAACYDLPVLYTYTDYGYAEQPAPGTELDELINVDKKNSFSYSLITNPDTVLYSAYSYGYTSVSNSDIVNKLFNTSKVFENDAFVEPSSVFVRNQKNNAVYYIGFAHEYGAISAASRAGEKSFVATPLTGKSVTDTIIFPETWSVSKESSSLNQQMSELFLYFIVSNTDGQSDISTAGNVTYYLPIYSKTVDSIKNNTQYYKNIFESVSDATDIKFEDINSINDKAEKIAQLSQDKNSKEEDVEKLLK